MRRAFLLSPARCDGRRAQMLLNPRATFDLAMRLSGDSPGSGASIGDVFSFLSGLYFRGKLTYANAFTDAAMRHVSPRIITTNRGLVSADTLIRRDDIIAFT